MPSGFAQAKPLQALRAVKAHSATMPTSREMRAPNSMRENTSRPRPSRSSGGVVEAVTRINPDLKAPIAKGQQVGEVVVTLGGETIATQPVVAMEAVEEAGFLVRIWHHLKRFLTSLF